MKKALVLLMVLTSLTWLGGLRQAHATLTLTADRLAVQGSVTGLYWWADLTSFNGFNGVVNGVDMTYAGQQGVISTLPGGTWHMATWEEMLGLAQNSAAAIHSTFTPLAHNSDVGNGILVDVFVGRYDLSISAGSHQVGSMDWDTVHNVQYFPDPATGASMFLNSSAADDGFGGISAWVVTESYTPAVPVPSTLLLLGSGLAGLAGFRRKFGKG
jgi:hypothetical protein